MISSADLYRELIEEWLRFEERRARPPGAGPTLTARERRHAVTALALRLWRTTDQVINLSELTATTSAALDAMTDRTGAARPDPASPDPGRPDSGQLGSGQLGSGQLDSGQAAHMVGSGSLLVRGEDGGFTFIHQSVMEYLVAAAAAAGLDERNPDGNGDAAGPGEEILTAVVETAGRTKVGQMARAKLRSAGYAD